MVVDMIEKLMCKQYTIPKQDTKDFDTLPYLSLTYPGLIGIKLPYDLLPNVNHLLNYYNNILNLSEIQKILT
jgi:hypothetical protein